MHKLLNVSMYVNDIMNVKTGNWAHWDEHTDIFIIIIVKDYEFFFYPIHFNGYVWSKQRVVATLPHGKHLSVLMTNSWIMFIFLFHLEIKYCKTPKNKHIVAGWQNVIPLCKMLFKSKNVRGVYHILLVWIISLTAFLKRKKK